MFQPAWAKGITSTCGFVVLFLATWSEIAVIVRRLNDLGRQRWEWVLMFLPVYNLYFGCVLLFSKGKTSRLEGPFGLLAKGIRLERERDWAGAFAYYRRAAVELRGHPDGEYAVECIRRLHEKLELADSTTESHTEPWLENE